MDREKDSSSVHYDKSKSDWGPDELIKSQHHDEGKEKEYNKEADEDDKKD